MMTRPMSGEQDLETLLRSLSAVLQNGLYVFATLADGQVPEAANPVMIFQEGEGTTLILPKSEAVALGMAYEFPCWMITLNVHSLLEAVGFIARIASVLARQGMGVNPVSGFYYDHLFVPDGREAEAMDMLAQIAAGDI